MNVLRSLALSTLVFAACLPAECRSAPTGGSSASSGGGVACPDLDAGDVGDCVARHAKSEGDRLASKYAELDEAAATACFDLPGPTIGDCLTKAQDMADQALDRALRAAMASIDGSSETPADAAKWKGQLQEAQRRWAAFRDADCDELVDSEYMGGTGAGQAGGRCMLGKTLSRAEEIRSRYVDR